MADRKPQTEDKYMLRLPDGMRDRIKAVAATSGRSMNALIVDALEERFPSTTQRHSDMQYLINLSKKIRSGESFTDEGVKHFSELYRDIALAVAKDLLENPLPGHGDDAMPRTKLGRGSRYSTPSPDD